MYLHRYVKHIIHLIIQTIGIIVGIYAVFAQIYCKGIQYRHLHTILGNVPSLHSFTTFIPIFLFSFQYRLCSTDFVLYKLFHWNHILCAIFLPKFVETSNEKDRTYLMWYGGAFNCLYFAIFCLRYKFYYHAYRSRYYLTIQSNNANCRHIDNIDTIKIITKTNNIYLMYVEKAFVNFIIVNKYNFSIYNLCCHNNKFTMQLNNCSTVIGFETLS